MSKLFSKYEKLKEKDKSKIYLLKSGIFYVALDKDAEYLSNAIGFKLTNLNENIQKCGFPVNRIDYYKKIFDIGNINYEIVDDELECININKSDQNKQLNKILNKLVNINFDNITYKQAFEILEDISKKLKRFNI